MHTILGCGKLRQENLLQFKAGLLKPCRKIRSRLVSSRVVCASFSQLWGYRCVLWNLAGCFLLPPPPSFSFSSSAPPPPPPPFCSLFLLCSTSAITLFSTFLKVSLNGELYLLPTDGIYFDWNSRITY